MKGWARGRINDIHRICRCSRITALYTWGMCSRDLFLYELAFRIGWYVEKAGTNWSRDDVLDAMSEFFKEFRGRMAGLGLGDEVLAFNLEITPICKVRLLRFDEDDKPSSLLSDQNHDQRYYCLPYISNDVITGPVRVFHLLHRPRASREREWSVASPSKSSD